MVRPACIKKWNGARKGRVSSCDIIYVKEETK
jgi:hypothetical protein